MTCGRTMNVPARKDEKIVAYCIAQCKRHGGKRDFNATTVAFALVRASEANDDF